MKITVILLAVVAVILIIAVVIQTSKVRTFTNKVKDEKSGGRSGGRTPEPFERTIVDTRPLQDQTGGRGFVPSTSRMTAGSGAQAPCLCWGNIWHTDCCKKGSA